MAWFLDVAAALALFAVVGLARLSGGAHWNVMAVVAMVWCAGGVLLRVWGLLVADPVGLGWPPDQGPWPQAWHSAVRGGAWVSVAAATQVAIVQCQFDRRGLRQVRGQLLGLYALCLAGALLPVPGRGVVVTAALGLVGVVFAYDLVRGLWGSPSLPHVTLHSPFAEPAFVFHGGDSPLLNHHHPIPQQRHAVDLVTTVDGFETPGDPTSVEGHACWNLPLLAPASGEVVGARDDLPDQRIGETDDEHLVGNHVVLQIDEERYVLLAHLRQGSLAVATGDRVQVGQPVGRCGNSGNTGGPHLHIQVSNRATFSNDDAALRTFPIRWVLCQRRGRVGPGVARRNDTLLPPRAREEAS